MRRRVWGLGRVLCWAFVLMLALAAVGSLWAQEQGGDEASEGAVVQATTAPEKEQLTGGFYFSILGLLYLAVMAVILFAVLAWVNDDCGRIQQSVTLWCLLLGSLGLLHFVLVLVLPNIYLGSAVGVVLFAFAVGAYVWVRNSRVPEIRQVLTPYHLGLLFRRFMYRFGVVMTAPQPKAAGRQGEGTPMMLHQHDGVIRDETQEARPEGDGILALKSMLSEAASYRATEVQLEPDGEELAVRYTIDGVAHNYSPVPAELKDLLLATVTSVAGIEPGTRPRPQKGSFSGEFPTLGKTISFQASVSPAEKGRRVHLAMEDGVRVSLPIEQVGMTERMVSQVSRLAEASRGMLLVAGPSAGGKTTTLYAILGTMDVFQRNVMTLECPVEHQLQNVNQTACEVPEGPEFVNRLRSLFRQAPDVMMVGELRDGDTATLALRSAGEEHLVFSSLEAVDAVGAIFRLAELGVGPAAMASALTAILAQRLVRVLCPQCKVPYKPKRELLERLKLPSPEIGVFYRSAGCPACAGTGFFGRTGIFELLVANDELRGLMRSQPSATRLRDAATKAGMVPLYQAGLEKVIAGVTSIKEMLRVLK